MDPAKIIELVEKSPAIVARHDREAWLGLFSKSAIAQDPVGAGPNRKNADYRDGKDALGRFYDIFISANDIKFNVYQDIVNGNEMARDVYITTTLPNGAISRVPAYLIYRAVEEDGELKLEALSAYWDFVGNSMGLMLDNGLKGMIAGCQQFGIMIKTQGLKRVMEYCKAGYVGIFKKGHRAVTDFATAVNANDEGMINRLFEKNATVEFPVGAKMSVEEFLAQNKGLHLEVSGLRSGGWFTACVYDAKAGKQSKHGVAFFEFSPATKKIISARFFA